MEPDFLNKEFENEENEKKKEPDKKINYSEPYHLDGIDDSIHSLYQQLKNYAAGLDTNISVNPRKYYIAFNGKKNFLYLYLKKKRIALVPIVPVEIGEQILKNHKIKRFSASVQAWYNGPCFESILENDENLDEIFELIKKAYEGQK